MAALSIGTWAYAKPAAGPLPGGTLDPTSIPKFVESLVIPPSMPQTASADPAVSYYEIAVRQFEQQILPVGMPQSTVWSYGSVNHPGTFNYPAFTIEAKRNKPVRVKWINDLKDAAGNFLPHLMPVDQTLHWANPPGGTTERDMRGTDPTPYKGPVPISVHLHGGHSSEESDGYPTAWFLPAANDIPAGYATVGSLYDSYKAKFEASHPGVTWEPGTAVLEYANDQRAATLWYHDHTMGMTRLNVMAGPAGFYLLRGAPGDLAAAGDMDLGYNPPGATLGQGVGLGPITEIPLAIQDRSFNQDGSIFYPTSRQFFDGFSGPYAPESDIAPIWNPEFFGNTMVVNGRTWPRLNVERRRYRLRLLNGSDSRFLILAMSNGLPFHQIGSDGGLLPKQVEHTRLLLGPAERADVIVDFSKVPLGTQIVLQNLGPDSPFGGGNFAPSDPGTTGQVMRFDVVSNASTADATVQPAKLRLPAFTKLGKETNRRQVSLNEAMSDVLMGVGPRAAHLGVVSMGKKPTGVPLGFEAPVTENPAMDSIETWEIYNFTADAHPIHIHAVQFQVVDRQGIGSPTLRPPEPGEDGDKDTVIAYPGEITRVKARYDIPGLFVWHCHIISHEDNEMMRPFRIGSGSMAMPMP
ncbi:MAG: multicopper oxidase domain-containing protein [Elusimicrobia bacterium]|nr:multicopper oxidase domain-containing protein [Elusimicrobiota bacterium]